MFSSFSIKFFLCSSKILIFIILWLQAPLSSMNWMSAKLILNSILWLSESQTIKKVGHWRIDAFELWCWRRLLRVPWTARRSNQSILKEISPEYSLEGLMLKLKLWLPDPKNWLTGKDPDAGKDWRQEEKGMAEETVGWHHWLNGHEFEQALGVGDGQGSLACCSSCSHKDTTEGLNWIKYSSYTFSLNLASLPTTNPPTNLSLL